MCGMRSVSGCLSAASHQADERKRIDRPETMQWMWGLYGPMCCESHKTVGSAKQRLCFPGTILCPVAVPRHTHACSFGPAVSQTVPPRATLEELMQACLRIKPGMRERR